MPNLIFNEEAHTYTFDGKVLPSITQLIKPLVDYSSAPKAILENAASFGKNVHRMVELECSGCLDETTLDDKLRPVLDTFRKWRQASDLAAYVPACEIPMAHARLGYAGTPDLIYDGLAVVEIKTRKTNRLTDPIQTAAQELLWMANGGAAGALGKPAGHNYSHHVLELYADGTHRFETFKPKETKEAVARFRYLLDAHKMNQTIQAWRKS